MAKLISQPIRRYTNPRPLEQDEKQYIEARINGGMVTDLDASDLPLNTAQLVRNIRVRYDRTCTRDGTITFGPTKPNSNRVLSVYPFRQNDGTANTLRFTHVGVHKKAGTWSALTTGVALTGTVTDRFNITTAFNKCVFTNNGVDSIQLIDDAVATYAPLGAGANARKYKFITAFADRIIGAYRTDAGSESPVEVGWSGNANITIWQNATDISAGVTPLAESPGDFADSISGIFGFSQFLAVLREKSLWLATKQPVATFPFNFRTAFGGAGIGCDCPYATTVALGGLIFASNAYRSIWVWDLQNPPERISTGNEKQLFAAIQNPDQVFGSFDPKELEYTIAVPTVSNTVKVWVHNFRTKAWAYDEIENLTTINDVGEAGTTITIGDLVGTIGGLTGTIGSLASTGSDNLPVRLYGFNNGDITQEFLTAQDVGVDYTSTFISKNYYFPRNDTKVLRLQVEFDVLSAGDISLYYSKDAGVTWTLAKTKTFGVNKTAKLTWNKVIRSKKFTWKIESANCMWCMLDYEIQYVAGGKTTGR
jgi:hypothetical protein